MSVGYKKKTERKNDLTSMQQAIRDRNARERKLKEQAALEAEANALLKRADVMLILNKPNTESWIALGKWQTLCREVIKAAKRSGKRYVWNDWAVEGVLRITGKQMQVA